MDPLTPAQRKLNMSRIRGRDTGPEMTIRRGLHALGHRYRLHDRRLPGAPDLVFPGRKAVVFVHGCFWHRHGGCRYATTPYTRAEFWAAKFDANVWRDNAVRVMLLGAAWRVATVWECALRKPDRIPSAVLAVSDWLKSEEITFELGMDELEAHSISQAGSCPHSEI